MNKEKLLKIQKQAEKWAKAAGNILQKYQSKAKVKKRKTDFLDLVTDADIASEKFLINKIQKFYPTHNIISEEAGEIRKDSEFTWILDPLGGTKEYTKGLPLYHISIVLEHKKRSLVGIVYRPSTGELFSSSKSNGSFLNGKRLFVSEEKNLKNCFIWTHSPDFKTPETQFQFVWQILEKIARNVYRLRFSIEDDITLCWVAQRAVDGFVLLTTFAKWWDFAAGLLMVEEAGGKVTDIYGSPIKNRNLSRGIVASNGKIHEELLRYLKM